jgi:hypothetical protein
MPIRLRGPACSSDVPVSRRADRRSTTSIRKLAFAALLAVTTLNFAPSLASAQEPAHGRFTLTHEVHWGNARVPAGEYEFSFDLDSVSPVLSLKKIRGERAGFIVLVATTEASTPSDSNRLVLETTAAGTFVKAMQLPEFGMTLDFTIPHTAGRQIARAGSGTASGQ